MRLLLAGAWAANPLFYTFAHSVGSEALGLILVLLFAAVGLRIISYGRRVPRKEWMLFGFLLLLCILTRHVNALLAVLAPVTFLLVTAHSLTMMAFTCSNWRRQALRLRTKQGMRRAGVALAIGFSCIVLANVSLRGLCYATDVPYHFPSGISFLWRLKFLPTLPPEKANELLDRVARDSSAPEFQRVVSQLREAARGETDWPSTTFMREAEESLFGSKSKSHEEFWSVLNRVVLSFLWPPRDVFMSAVLSDFARARLTTIPELTRSLFVHTIFYYSHREAMPGYAALVTFRDRGADEVMNDYKQHAFFHGGKRFSYNGLWCLWLAVIAVFAVVRKRGSRDVAVWYYALALSLIGLAVMLATCLLCEFQPRYTLPMWQLTIISMTVAFGRSFERRLRPEQKACAEGFRSSSRGSR